MRAAPALLGTLVLVVVGLAGCLGPGTTPLDPAGLVAAMPFLPAPGLPEPPRFAPEVVVDAELGGTEPSLVVDPEGRVFVAAPTGLAPTDGQLSGQFWRSLDGGASFEHLPGLGAAGLYGPSIGGGDSDIATDAQGNLYAIDLWLGNVGFLASFDHGDTWLQGSPLTFASAGDDRQWIDVNQATDEVYVAVNSLSTGLWVAKSADQGLTFPQQTLAVAHADRGGCICPPGVLAVDEASGNVYLPFYMHPQGVGLAISRDGGASFEAYEVPSTESAHLPDDEAGELGGAFTVVTHDRQGNLYLVWETATPQGRRVALQTSVDQGQSWSLPLLVADMAAGEQIFPWVVAGDAGRLAIAWYEVDAERAWNVRLAMAEHGLDARPSFQVVTLNAQPVHRGGYDRALLGDFFELALDPQGRMHAVWNARLADGKEAIVATRQVGGPLLLAGLEAPASAPARPVTLGAVPLKPSPPAAVAEEAAREARSALGLPER